MTPNLINLCAGVSKKLVAGEIELNCHVKFGCVKFQRCRRSRWNYTANVKEPRWRWNHGHHKNNAVFGFGLATISLGAALAILQAAWHSSKTRSAECKKQGFTTNRKQHVPAHIGDCTGLLRITPKNITNQRLRSGFFRPAPCSEEGSVWDKLIALRKHHTMLCAYIRSRGQGSLSMVRLKQTHHSWTSRWQKNTSCEQHGSSSTNAAEYLQAIFFAFHCLKMFSALVCSAALFGLAMLPPEHKFKIRMWHTGNFCQLLVHWCAGYWMKKDGRDWSIV